MKVLLPAKIDKRKVNHIAFIYIYKITNYHPAYDRQPNKKLWWDFTAENFASDNLRTERKPIMIRVLIWKIIYTYSL